MSLSRSSLREFSSASKLRNFMSSMTAAAPDEEGHFALILGKPGGGKGTISGKILKVRLLKSFPYPEFRARPVFF
jgi:hypothetical protein